MEYTVPVDSDAVSELVRQSLEESIDLNVRSGDESIEGSALLISLVVTHKYYSTHEQHQALLAEYGSDVDATVTLVEKHLEYDDQAEGVHNIETSENEDGSLTFSFDASDEEIQQLASKGAEYAVLMAVLGDPSPGDLIRWVERGKHAEQTDDIMRRFIEAKAEVESK